MAQRTLRADVSGHNMDTDLGWPTKQREGSGEGSSEAACGAVEVLLQAAPASELCRKYDSASELLSKV